MFRFAFKSAHYPAGRDHLDYKILELILVNLNPSPGHDHQSYNTHNTPHMLSISSLIVNYSTESQINTDNSETYFPSEPLNLCAGLEWTKGLI